MINKTSIIFHRSNCHIRKYTDIYIFTYKTDEILTETNKIRTVFKGKNL